MVTVVLLQFLHKEINKKERDRLFGEYSAKHFRKILEKIEGLLPRKRTNEDECISNSFSCHGCCLESYNRCVDDMRNIIESLK